MLTALVTLTLLSTAPARAEEAALSGIRCETVKTSAVLDLPAFCKEKLQKERLVDYGFQLALLEKQCGEGETARRLKEALRAKVHSADAASCGAVAADLVRSLEPR